MCDIPFALYCLIKKCKSSMIVKTEKSSIHVLSDSVVKYISKAPSTLQEVVEGQIIKSIQKPSILPQVPSDKLNFTYE